MSVSSDEAGQELAELMPSGWSFVVLVVPPVDPVSVLCTSNIDSKEKVIELVRAWMKETDEDAGE